MRHIPEVGMALGVVTTGTGVVAEGLNISQGFYNQFHHTLNDPVLLGNFHYDSLPYTALTLELSGLALFVACDYLRDRRNAKSRRQTATF